MRLEDGCLAFLNVEPVLAECIDDVGSVRDEDVVLARFGRLCQHRAQCFRMPQCGKWSFFDASHRDCQDRVLAVWGLYLGIVLIRPDASGSKIKLPRPEL